MMMITLGNLEGLHIILIIMMMNMVQTRKQVANEILKYVGFHVILNFCLSKVPMMVVGVTYVMIPK